MLWAVEHNGKYFNVMLILLSYETIVVYAVRRNPKPRYAARTCI